MEPEVVQAAQSLPSQFNWMSWMIVAAYVVFTTWLGRKLSGKQATIKDFFLGGRKLPWWAVSGSVIACEISAMTLVGVPAFLWAETGNMAYMVLGIGSIVSRIIVGFFFVPAYYEREIYSPYEYIGEKLGAPAQKVTSTLFMIGGSLGQGTRVLLTAMVAHVITDWDVYTCIWLTGLVAIVWVYLGGMVTVIWTDVIQFFIFLFSALVTLYAVGTVLVQNNISIGEMISAASAAGKFHWLDFSFDLRAPYTFWAAVIASSIGGLNAYGVDQMMVQRCFCCKGPKEARKAIIWSCIGQVIMIICLFVGVALWVFYKKAGLPGVPSAEEAMRIQDKANYILPVFTRYRISWWLGGIILAGIFAAAISSLQGILAALAERTLATMKSHGFNPRDDKHAIAASRVMVMVWGAVLCGVASLFWAVWKGEGLIIELALSVVGLTAGGILGVFLMAFIPKWRRQSEGMEFSAALSMMTVFAFMQHPKVGDGTLYSAIAKTFSHPSVQNLVAVWSVFGLALAAVLVILFAAQFRMKHDPLVIPKMIPFIALAFFIQLFRFADSSQGGEVVNVTVGWPWYSIVGLIIMLVASWLLCKPVANESKT